MKMILLLHLEDDEALVSRLLKDHGVVAWSRLPLEGHGSGAAGWYGEAAPYRSRMAFTVVPEDRATHLREAVKSLEGLADPEHPVHALQMQVERCVDSGFTEDAGAHDDIPETRPHNTE
jgi:hypothetical protein